MTFSGGEPLLQIDKLEALLESLDINICFETALFISQRKLKKAMKYADEFIVDIKLLNALYSVYNVISCAEATSNMSNLTGIIFGPRATGDNYIIGLRDSVLFLI